MARGRVKPLSPLKSSLLTRSEDDTEMSYLPGLLLVIALAAAARASSNVLPPVISEVTVGVVFGLVVANALSLPQSLKQGVMFAVTVLLRMGIVLLGARLALGDVLTTGLGALLIIAIGISGALVLAYTAGRWLGVPPRLALLIGVGTAICGNSAIMATAPVIEAKEREISFAVATITLFGTIAVFIYPLLGHLAGLSDVAFGHWAGVAVNDTSQVAAAGFAYSADAGETATVVKLTRNTLLGPVIVLVGLWYARSGLARPSLAERRSSAQRLLTLFPPFVFGFLVLAAFNSLGMIPEPAQNPINESARALILVALVGVGLSTRFEKLTSIGAKPLALGLAASTLLSMVALAVIIVLFAGL
jgi:uncharacterized integral membrane protein (TIGR00698 family)